MISGINWFIRVWFLVALVPLPALSFQLENQSYLPLTPLELRQRFSVKYVGTLGSRRPGYFENTRDQDLPGSLNVGVSEASVSVSDEEGLAIAGRDKRERPWNVRLGISAVAYACRFYVADLDRNGLLDLILVFPTGGNGLAPSSHVLTLTFDETGRPVSFEADGYFEATAEGILDLVDLDRDGHAELLYMNFDDGYWITNLYEISNARWRLIKGPHGRRIYPLYTRFTNRPNRKPVVPRRGRHPMAPDLSNTLPMARGRLVSYKWADVSHSDDVQLTVKTSQGKTVISKPNSWYGSFVVVLDGKDGRRIISLSAGEDAVKSALNEVIKDGYEVALYGQRSGDTSIPEILWARARK